MKKIILLIFTFSFLLIFLTFLNYQIEVLDSQIKKADFLNEQMEKELNFLKSE